MTIFVSIDTESGAMRRYDSRYRGGDQDWCRYECLDIDWDFVHAEGRAQDVVHSLFFAPSWKDHR